MHEPVCVFVCIIFTFMLSLYPPLSPIDTPAYTHLCTHFHKCRCFFALFCRNFLLKRFVCADVFVTEGMR